MMSRALTNRTFLTMRPNRFISCKCKAVSQEQQPENARVLSRLLLPNRQDPQPDRREGGCTAPRIEGGNAPHGSPRASRRGV